MLPALAKAGEVTDDKTAEISLIKQHSGVKFSIFDFWHISFNKMLYYTENVFI